MPGGTWRRFPATRRLSASGLALRSTGGGSPLRLGPSCARMRRKPSARGGHERKCRFHADPKALRDLVRRADAVPPRRNSPARHRGQGRDRHPLPRARGAAKPLRARAARLARRHERDSVQEHLRGQPGSGGAGGAGRRLALGRAGADRAGPLLGGLRLRQEPPAGLGCRRAGDDRSRG